MLDAGAFRKFTRGLTADGKTVAQGSEIGDGELNVADIRKFRIVVNQGFVESGFLLRVTLQRE